MRVAGAEEDSAEHVRGITGPRVGSVVTELLRWNGRAEPEAVGIIRHRLTSKAAKLGAEGEALERVRLAVTEAVTNVVVHAYREAPEPGEVTVVAAQENAGMTVLVYDNGMGLLPRVDSPGLGLGLGLMAQVTDDFDIRTRAAGGVEVRLHFVFDREQAGAAA